MSESTDVERLLRSALTPVDPPEALSDRLERTLTEITDAAADELADWELAAMRDPRNWGRTLAAGAVVAVAGGALVLVRTRQAHRRRQARGLRALERSVRDVAGGVRRRVRG
jgi:hypothetical protein